jgi:MFS family permease
VPRLSAYLRSLHPELPRAVWVLQFGGLLNAFGNGIVLPFLIIYLHNVRGISLGSAGLIAAANSAAALCSGFVAGSLADRVGPKRVLIGALLLMAVAVSLFPLIRSAGHAFLLTMLLGLGSGAFWPSQSILLTGLTPADRRHSAFSVQRVTMNLGVALGGLTGGLIASSGRPETFTILFLLDAATFVGYALVVLRLPAPRRSKEPDTGSYRRVLTDRPFVSYILLNALFIAASMAVIIELLPPFAKNDAGVDEQQIGFIWAVNSLVIVFFQLPVAKLVEGRRRMRGLAAMGLIWAGVLLVVGAAGYWTSGITAAVIMAGAAGVFGLGECLHGSIHLALAADLARPGVVGRYLALSSQSWQIGWILGPAAGGFLLQHAPYALWPIAAGANLVGSAWALGLERRLPKGVRLTPHVAVRRAVLAAEPGLGP